MCETRGRKGVGRHRMDCGEMLLMLLGGEGCVRGQEDQDVTVVMCEERSRVRDTNTLNLELWDHSKMAGWPHFIMLIILLCVCREKRAWYTLFAHAQFPQHFWEFGTFHRICSITLTSARHADFFCVKDACH